MRGQSTAASMLLMVLIAVSLTSAVFYWSSSLTVQSASTHSGLIYRSSLQASENFRIEEVGFKGKLMNIYVRNAGDIPVNLTAVYISDSVSGRLLFRKSLNLTAAPQTVTPIRLEFQKIVNQSLSIQVASKQGNISRRDT